MRSKILNVLRVGAVALALGAGQIASAQTTTTPGVPTTGLGGAALSNILALIFSLSLVGIGMMIARKAQRMS